MQKEAMCRIGQQLRASAIG